MTQPSGTRPRAARWTAATVLLLLGVVGTLIVPVYARTAPKWGGFPFFYWYQLAWIPLVGILSTLAYLLVRRSR
jgi:Protein of unknown function (DUF3311)